MDEFIRYKRSSFKNNIEIFLPFFVGNILFVPRSPECTLDLPIRAYVATDVYLLPRDLES